MIVKLHIIKVREECSIASLLKPKSSDFSLPVSDVVFASPTIILTGAGIRTFRLRNLREIFIYSPDEEKRPPRQAATINPCNQNH
jgi:hypothetical protein